MSAQWLSKWEKGKVWEHRGNVSRAADALVSEPDGGPTGALVKGHQAVHLQSVHFPISMLHFESWLKKSVNKKENLLGFPTAPLELENPWKYQILLHRRTQPLAPGRPESFAGRGDGTHEALMSSCSLSWSSRFRLSTSTLSSMFFQTRSGEKRNSVKHTGRPNASSGEPAFSKGWLAGFSHNKQILDSHPH